MTIVTAFQGESLDQLVWRSTGRSVGAVEMVLGANRGLAERALALPELSPVLIPVLPDNTASTDLIQLWD